VGTGTRRTRLTVALATVLAAAGSLTGASAQGTAWPAELAFSRPEAVGGGVFVVQRSGRMRLLSTRGLSPSWSPDGRRLAYVAPASGGLDVYVADADGRHRSPLTRTPGVSESGPKWSPDGRRLVVERDGRLWVIRADRRGDRFLANGREFSWSHRRSRIAFVGAGDDLYLVQPNGHGQRRLTTTPTAVESQPAWSPDGRRIAYVALEGQSTDLYVLDVASSTVIRLTQDVDGEASPVWGPGGRKITFVGDRPGGPLWSVPAEGGVATPLGGPSGVDLPAWRPPISLERPPDLDQRPPTDLSFQRTQSGRYLLGFTSASDNVGIGPLSIVASRPSRAVPTMRASQRVRRIGGGAKTYPEVGVLRYTIAPPHQHWHLMDFQRYELRRAGDHSLVIADRKSGFCLADHWGIAGHVAGRPARAVFHGNCKQFEPGALAVEQGTSVGYTDRYPAYFHGQNLDVTRVRAGIYVLVHRANGEMPLAELRYENNAASVRVRFSWPRGSGHQPAIRVLRSCPGSEWCGPSR
jgi:hypothetical protein